METSTQTQSAEPRPTQVHPLHRQELVGRVALFDRGLAALSSRELALAASLGIRVDFTPATYGTV